MIFEGDSLYAMGTDTKDGVVKMIKIDHTNGKVLNKVAISPTPLNLYSNEYYSRVGRFFATAEGANGEPYFGVIRLN